MSSNGIVNDVTLQLQCVLLQSAVHILQLCLHIYHDTTWLPQFMCKISIIQLFYKELSIFYHMTFLHHVNYV